VLVLRGAKHPHYKFEGGFSPPSPLWFYHPCYKARSYPEKLDITPFYSTLNIILTAGYIA